MAQCKICKKDFKSTHSFSGHLKHHNLTKKEYYDLHKQPEEGKCKVCKKETTFRGTHYLKYCSRECVDLCPEIRLDRSERRKDKKQNPEVIEQRIKNTDQTKKEAKRQQTLIERYGDPKLPFRVKRKPTTKPSKPRTPEWSRKIIESKRRNGTLKHKESTKLKIKKYLEDLHESDDAPLYVSSKPNSKKYIQGYINNIFYRSSYEKFFIEYCVKNNISIETAETKEFRVRYFDETGKMRWYYPDFYLEDYDMIVEIKPLTMIGVLNNIEKMDSAAKKHSFAIITEEELENLDEFFSYL